MYGALVLNFVFLFLTISLRLFEFVLHVWQATTVIVFCVLYFLRCAVAGNRRTLCVLSCRYCVAGNHHTNFSSNLNLYSCDRSIESPFCLANPPLTLFISFVCVIGNILVHRPGNRHSVLRPSHTSLFIRKIPGELV